MPIKEPPQPSSQGVQPTECSGVDCCCTSYAFSVSVAYCLLQCQREGSNARPLPDRIGKRFHCLKSLARLPASSSCHHPLQHSPRRIVREHIHPLRVTIASIVATRRDQVKHREQSACSAAKNIDWKRRAEKLRDLVDFPADQGDPAEGHGTMKK